MELITHRIPLTKRYPLTISRGTITGSVNLLVEVTHDGVTGWGEMAPGGDAGDTAEAAEADLAHWGAVFAAQDVAPDQRQLVAQLCAARPGLASARAALDMALFDWAGRRLGLPVWRLWGLDLTRIPATSLTIGINPPDVVRERVSEVLTRTGAHSVKVKLGAPAGEDADRDMFTAAQEGAADAARRLLESQGVALRWRVDANGGWTVDGARRMCRWLVERGVEYVEQPLPRGQEDDLAHLHGRIGLPLYVDESVRVATDVARVANHVDGVNLKLMKCGGLDEALRIVHTARAHGLGVMIGCMGESSLSITAGAHLSPLVDHVDLDSHLNLLDDPFTGAVLQNGRVVPGDAPGLGVAWAPGCALEGSRR